MKGIGDIQCYYDIFHKKVSLKWIRRERISKETKKKVSHVIIIVMYLLWFLVDI